jgi:hypothetical protein
MSGLSHTPGKRAWGKTHRGFESRLLRQKMEKAHVDHGLFFVYSFWLSNQSPFGNFAQISILTSEKCVCAS